MAIEQWAAVLGHVQKLFHGASVVGLTEGQLLDRFIDSRDETAFGAIVARHGPMVLGVCRGILRDRHDVEDAFQATFLILVKKARSLRNKDRLAPWLYGVARRVSLRARDDAIGRKRKESADPPNLEEPSISLDSELRELQSLIRDEVDRLSNHDRMAVVLCYLEGLTHEEAADRLGWPIGTVKGRLSRAREKLKIQLTRRGVTLPTVFVANLGRSVSTMVPTSLIQSTTLAASRLGAGKTLTAGMVSAHALTLMEGAIGPMFATPLKIAATVFAATSLIAIPGFLAARSGSEMNPQVKSVEAVKPVETRAETNPASTDVAESSTEAIVKLSEEAIRTLDRSLSQPGQWPSVEKYYQWSRRLAEAKSRPNVAEADRKSALQAHLDRMKKLAEMADQSLAAAGSQIKPIEPIEARFRVLEATGWVRDGRIGDTLSPQQPKGTAGSNNGFVAYPEGIGAAPERPPLTIRDDPADEKRNEAIRAKLNLPIAMKFATETPLEDVKKYIQDATTDEKSGFPGGIPIYVDPQGLQNADLTMASTISLDLEGIPLRTTLKLLLRQLKLDYKVTGGLLLISDEDSIQAQESQELIERIKASRKAAPR